MDLQNFLDRFSHLFHGPKTIDVGCMYLESAMLGTVPVFSAQDTHKLKQNIGSRVFQFTYRHVLTGPNG